MKATLTRVTLFLSLLCFLPDSGMGQKTASAFLLRGKAAPDFQLPLLDNRFYDRRDNGSMAPKSVRLSEERGKIVVLNFWATWCTPCKLEHPTLVSAKRKYAGQGVEVYSVLIEDDVKRARKYVAEGNTGLPILIGDGTDIGARYGVGRGVPVTFFINSSGAVSHVRMGGPIKAEEIAAVVDSLLGLPSASKEKRR